jgi:hypothetical protein
MLNDDAPGNRIMAWRLPPCACQADQENFAEAQLNNPLATDARPCGAICRSLVRNRRRRARHIEPYHRRDQANHT